MEKVKEFLQDNKKTTILAFVGSAILLAYYLCFYAGSDFISIILYQTSVIGFAVYFAMILLKMYKKKVNIKVANYILIITLIIQTVSYGIMTIARVAYGIADIEEFVEIIVNVISIIYFFNILLKKPNFINNKVYLITVIVGFAFQMIQPSFFSSGEILLNLCSLTVVPYFYNYYESSKNK